MQSNINSCVLSTLTHKFLELHILLLISRCKCVYETQIKTHSLWRPPYTRKCIVIFLKTRGKEINLHMRFIWNSVEFHCFCELKECKVFAAINNRRTGLPWGWLAGWSRSHDHYNGHANKSKDSGTLIITKTKTLSV